MLLISKLLIVYEQMEECAITADKARPFNIGIEPVKSLAIITSLSLKWFTTEWAHYLIFPQITEHAID